MSNLTHVSSAVSAAAQKASAPAKGADSQQDASDEPSEFNSMFENYVESEQKQSSASPETAEQKIKNQASASENKNVPQQGLQAGNALPAEDTAAMWQALMMLQPSETAMNNTAVNSNAVNSSQQMQTGLLLEQQKKSVQQPSLIENALSNSKATNNTLLDKQPTSLLNSSLLEQDYYQSLVMQQQTDSGLPVSANLNNHVSTQLAAAHFTPERSEALLLNMNEQLSPTQGMNSNLQSGLAAAGLAGAAQAAPTQTHMAPLNLGQNAWEANFGSRLQMMVGQNIQTAEIRLDPPELGALDIKIKVNNDIASVNITSPHSQVREALESAVPRLREMFAESGISLGDVNVQQESHTEQQQTSEGDSGRGGSNFSTEDEVDNESMPLSRQIVSNNLLDIYA